MNYEGTSKCCFNLWKLLPISFQGFHSHLNQRSFDKFTHTIAFQKVKRYLLLALKCCWFYHPFIYFITQSSSWNSPNQVLLEILPIKVVSPITTLFWGLNLKVAWFPNPTTLVLSIWKLRYPGMYSLSKNPLKMASKGTKRYWGYVWEGLATFLIANKNWPRCKCIP